MSQKGATATQLTLVFINFLFVTLGVTSMTVGGWVLIYRMEVRALTLIDVATNQFGLLQNAAILMITAGIAIFVLGFMGCCAAYKERRCLRVLYIGLVTLCCLVTVAACAVAFVYREQVEDKLLNHLQSKLKSEYQGFTTSEVDFSQALDYAQVEFQCCGIRSYKEFKETATKWTVKQSATVPPTCCVLTDRDAYLDDEFLILKDKNCVQNPNSTNSYINRPCYTELKDWMEEEVTILGAIAIAAIVLQILGILFIISLMRRQPKNTDYLYRDSNYF